MPIYNLYCMVKRNWRRLHAVFSSRNKFYVRIKGRLGRLFSVFKRGMTGDIPDARGRASSSRKENCMETMPNDTHNMKPKTKPIHEVRLGAIKAAVWRNETEAGVRYNVTFSRLYKDGDQWQSTDSFGRDDLLTLAKVADQAHSWIFTQGQEHESQPAT